MIVPQNRLLWLTGFTLVPAALVWAAFPGASVLAWIVPVLLAAGGAMDALRAARSLRGVRVEFPGQLNIAKAREETLPFRIRDESGSFRSLEIGLVLPEAVSSPWEVFRADLPADRSGLRIAWPITAWRRGEVAVEACCVRAVSPLGLWCGQGSLAAGTRIRVHPDLKKEYTKLAASFLRRDAPGLRDLRQVGRGREFEKLREYLPGDSWGDVHWKATAKRGRLVTKDYQIERTQDVYTVIDGSRLSARSVAVGLETKGGASEDSLLEGTISAALTFGDLIQRWGDKFGLATFDTQITQFIRAARGRSHFRACREALFGLQPQAVTPDFEELAGFFLQNLRRRALIVFLTSLDDPALAESFVHSMEPVSRRHVLLVAMVRPPLARPVFSDPNVAEPEDLYRNLGGHLQWQSLRELKRVLGRCGIGFSLMDRERLCVDMISRYLAVKRRQIL